VTLLPRSLVHRRFGASVLVCATLCWAAPASSGPLPAFTSGEVAKPMSEQEERVWTEAHELDEIIARSGLTYDDPALRAYVQQVTDRLYPEFKSHIRITLLKSPQLNAFAVPDGNIYVNIGLLARFQNEAQLATVMAHEGTHFTHRHGLQGQKNLKDNAALATFGSLLGIPILPQLLAISSIFGFSRELETEADMVGYQRLLQAGYDVREAPAVFKHLMDDVKAEDIKEPYFFSTHPKLKDRFDNMTRLSANAVGGGEGSSRSDYARIVQKARIDALESMLSMGRAKSALVALDDPEHLKALPPFAPYYLGEAYRLRDEKGDVERAEAAYRQAIEAAPDFAPAYRALGILQYKAGNYAAAVSNLERYVEMAPDARDRKFVERYLRNAKKKGESP
jgi:predicted Zn-dependent protease